MPALKETGTEHLIKHVKNIVPKKTSQLENDSGYITGISKSDVTTALGYTPPTTNTTYGVATSSALGLVKSGTDITVDSSGNVSVNDDSHNHVISNVDGLQSALDGKSDTGHTHTKSEITDFPTSMPASDVYDWAKAETKPSYTKSEVGLGNVENKSSATIRGEITKGNVTTALGYTPNTPTEVDTKIDTKINDLESYVITNDDIDSIFS